MQTDLEYDFLTRSLLAQRETSLAIAIITQKHTNHYCNLMRSHHRSDVQRIDTTVYVNVCVKKPPCQQEMEVESVSQTGLGNGILWSLYYCARVERSEVDRLDGPDTFARSNGFWG